jgi:hypothetical protein
MAIFLEQIFEGPGETADWSFHGSDLKHHSCQNGLGNRAYFRKL